jgi:predicted amidohydrolase
MAEALFLSSTVTARAFENTCAIVFVNAGGPLGKTKPGSYAGMSRLGLPFLEPLGDETKDSVEEGMSIVDLDMEVLEEAEKQYKVRDDMGRDDWHYTYRHDQYEKGKL